MIIFALKNLRDEYNQIVYIKKTVKLYDRITSDVAEGNNQEGLCLWQKAKILSGKNHGVMII